MSPTLQIELPSLKEHRNLASGHHNANGFHPLILPGWMLDGTRCNSLASALLGHAIIEESDPITFHAIALRSLKTQLTSRPFEPR